MSKISSELFTQSVNDKAAASWAGFGKVVFDRMPKFIAEGKIGQFFGGSKRHNISKVRKWFAKSEEGAKLLQAKNEATAAAKAAYESGMDRSSQEYQNLVKKARQAGKDYKTALKTFNTDDRQIQAAFDTYGKRVAGTAAGAVAGIGGTGYAIHKATEEPEHWYDRFTKSGNFNDIPLYLQDKIASGTGFEPLAMVDKTSGSGEDSVFIGGWKSKDGSRKNPSALGMISSGLLAGAADDLYTQRRAKGRGAVRSALGYLNAPIGALGGGLAGAALAPVTFGLSMPIGAAAGAAGQIAMAGNESPYVHILPTLGGAGVGAVFGAGIGGNVNTSPTRGFNDTGAIIGGLAGAGLGGLGGYALSRLIN